VTPFISANQQAGNNFKFLYLFIFTKGRATLGNPHKNVYIERADRTIHYNWPSKYILKLLDEVYGYATNRLWFFNNERPHKANGGRPPLMAA